MTFEKFMLSVEQAVMSLLQMSHEDFADAPWWDLWDDTDQGEECTNEIIYETLAEADDTFRQMWDLKKD